MRAPREADPAADSPPHKSHRTYRTYRSYMLFPWSAYFPRSSVSFEVKSGIGTITRYQYIGIDSKKQVDVRTFFVNFYCKLFMIMGGVICIKPPQRQCLASLKHRRQSLHLGSVRLRSDTGGKAPRIQSPAFRPRRRHEEKRTVLFPWDGLFFAVSRAFPRFFLEDKPFE